MIADTVYNALILSFLGFPKEELKDATYYKVEDKEFFGIEENRYRQDEFNFTGDFNHQMMVIDHIEQMNDGAINVTISTEFIEFYNSRHFESIGKYDRVPHEDKKDLIYKGIVEIAHLYNQHPEKFENDEEA